jgi:hypothetical protein
MKPIPEIHLSILEVCPGAEEQSKEAQELG